MYKQGDLFALSPCVPEPLSCLQEGLYNDADFQSLTPMELVSKTVPELREIIQERRERRETERAQMVERLAQVCCKPAHFSLPPLICSKLF